MKTTQFELQVADRRLKLDMPEEDHITRVVQETATFYEVGLLEDLTRRTRPRDLVIDVGAFIGNHTVYMAGVADLEVISIEPFRGSAEMLANNVSINGLDSLVEIHSVAAGSEDGTGTAEIVDEDNLGMVRIARGGGEVPIRTLDSIVAGRSIKALKIDVEGMELEVLDGATRTIEGSEPLIYVETSDILAERDLMEWMRQHGYRFTREFNETPTRLFTRADEVRASIYPPDLLDFGYTQVESMADLITEVRELRHAQHRFASEVKEYREQLRRTTSVFSELYKRVRAGSGQIGEIHRMLEDLLSRLVLDNEEEE